MEPKSVAFCLNILLSLREVGVWILESASTVPGCAFRFLALFGVYLPRYPVAVRSFQNITESDLGGRESASMCEIIYWSRSRNSIIENPSSLD